MAMPDQETASRAPLFLGNAFSVAGWHVDVRALEISSGGAPHKLEAKTMELLVCLANRANEVLTRDELVETVWQNVTVGYDSLTVAIAKLRKAFGDDSRHSEIIQTVPKVGYRLIASVEATRSDDNKDLRTSPLAEPMQPTLPVAATGPDPTGKPSIAVLAFQNLSGNSEQEFLGDAIAETIITELSRFSDLVVVARESGFFYKNKEASPCEIARDLGVGYLVEGSLQQNSNTIRVTVQLIEMPSVTHLWAERYDRDAEDLFIVQDEITQTVVATIATTIQLKERDRAARAHPANLAAYEYCLRAEKFWFEWSKEANEKALPLFEKCLELDPNLARGYVGLARVYFNGFRWGYLDLPREECLERALKAARKAIELDPFDYVGHLVFGNIHMRNGDLGEAAARYARALELNPNADVLLAQFAELRLFQGRYDEAIELMTQAMQRNPHHPDWYHWVLADTLEFAGRLDEALASMNRMASIPNIRAYRSLAGINVGLGRIQEARANIRDYLEHDPGFNLRKYREYIYSLPYQDDWIFEYSIDVLRKAGLPE